MIAVQANQALLSLRRSKCWSMGNNPKEYLVEYCCSEYRKWKDKLKRCESALKNMTNADPETAW